MKATLRCAVLLLLLTITCGHVYGQLQGQAKSDSLLKELAHQKDDTNKVNLLNGLAYSYHLSDPDEGVKYGQQALDLATKLEWETGIARANRTLGIVYCYGKSDIPKALKVINDALTVFNPAIYMHSCRDRQE